LVIDVSNSMAAEDVGTSRLSAAKAVAKRLAEAQEGRIALLVFEASPDVVSPLTSDTDAVIALLDTLQPGEVGQPGSDLGTALIAALRLIETDPLQKADIVVISDGEDQGARVSEAVQRAKSHGIAVSTVLVGSGEGSTIPTPKGALRELATSTGGRMLENPFAANALDPLLGSARAGAPRQTNARIPIDRYQWP